MKKIKPISLVFNLIITVSLFIVCAGTQSWTAENTPASGQTGSMPAAELGNKYSLEILSPSGIPVKTLYIKDPKGKISAIMDSEHGTQTLTNVSFDGKILKFTAILGTEGNESFDFTLKLYNGGILLGECEGGRGPSPVLLKALE